MQHRGIECARDDLRGAIEEAVQLATLGVDRHGIQVAVDLPQEPVMVSMDRVHIQVLATNLIRNAIDELSTWTGEKSLWVRLKVRDGNLAEFSVEDTGAGIAPEIYENIVRIESSAREPGARAKIAVSSRERDVDPVGARVGMKGSRVQAVVQELRGVKIDIVPYDDDPARFVCNAIAPAEVKRVIIDAEGHRMELIVPDDKLSLAIGKKGQNVRLASQLTGWRIDIHSESKIYELERRAKEQIASAIGAEGFDGNVSDNLFKLGWRSVSELARARIAPVACPLGADSRRDDGCQGQSHQGQADPRELQAAPLRIVSPWRHAHRVLLSTPRISAAGAAGSLPRA
jgi:transcription antitermination factor NusA-like protein